MVSVDVKHHVYLLLNRNPVPNKPTVSVDVKQHSAINRNHEKKMYYICQFRA